MTNHASPIACVLAAALGSCAFAAAAQTFPTQTVRLIVPTGAGGGLDVAARQLAQKLSESWPHQAIVENRTGAGGTIGVDAVAKAAPDGHTIGFVSSSFTTNAVVYAKLPYDSLRDLLPVTQTAFSPLMLVVNPSLPVRSVGELVALSKRRPGQVNYSTTGTGGVIHLSVELLKSMTGADFTHIPYKATVAAVTDVIGGNIEFSVTGLPVALPHTAAGKLRGLAVTGARRSAAAPKVPTIGESVPGYAFDNWHGILAPQNTPPRIVAQLNAAIVRALQSPDLRQRLLAQGDEPVGTTVDQFAAMVRQEIDKYAKLVKAIGVRLE